MRGQYVVHTTESDSLREALGIPEERCKELCHLIDEIAHEHEEGISVAQVLGEASHHCDTAGELAFVSFIAGRQVEAHRELNSALADFFQMMMQSKSKAKMPGFSMS